MVNTPSRITRIHMLRILIPLSQLFMVILIREAVFSLNLSMLHSRVIERIVYNPLDLTKLETITFGYNTFTYLDESNTENTLVMRSEGVSDN